MISNQKKFAFVHIPRTAGTSIEMQLKKYRDKNESVGHNTSIEIKNSLDCPCQHTCDGHNTALETKNVLGKNWDNYYTFTIVRNPWDRAISAYSYILQNDSWAKYPTFKMWITKNRKQFLREIARPQTDWILDENGDILVDHIFKFEDLKNAWKQICDDLNIKHITLETLLPSHHNHYSKYYTPETVEVIRETYKEEIEMFDYRFESHDGSFIIQ